MFMELVTNRRSIRRYLDKPVEKEKVELLLEAALRSPSSRSLNPWEFVVVTDARAIEKLAKAKPHGGSFLKNAPLAIVVCADPEVSDVWVEDAAIASVYLHLAAADLGLGSCWIQIRLRNHDENQTASDYVGQVLGLRKGLAVESILAIGYAAEQKPPHPRASLPTGKIRYHE